MGKKYRLKQKFICNKIVVSQYLAYFCNMNFSDIIGQESVKKHLIKTAKEGRIPHAQLFVAPEGSGALPLAIAYAQYVVCQNTTDDNEGGNASCNLKFNKLQHPDLHFVFPVDATDKKTSDNFWDDWAKFVSETPYGSLSTWHNHVGLTKKQGLISVHEASNISRKLALKSVEGGHKVMIIWMAERMNTEAANKILKLLEEPPQKTLFLLIVEDEKQLLQTITSRCQVIRLSPLPETDIQQALEAKGCNPSEAMLIAKQSNGSLDKAYHIWANDADELPFEKWFIQWVRQAFLVKQKTKVLADLLNWSEELSGIGRENQKRFLQYCIEMFRQALLANYGVNDLVYIQIKEENFELNKFAPYVNPANIFEIIEALSDAHYHIERNGNAKLIFGDLSLQLTKLIHKKI